jgi:hypothetical protein
MSPHNKTLMMLLALTLVSSVAQAQSRVLTQSKNVDTGALVDSKVKCDVKGDNCVSRVGISDVPLAQSPTGELVVKATAIPIAQSVTGEIIVQATALPIAQNADGAVVVTLTGNTSSFAPGVPALASMSANTSAAVTGLTTGDCFQISCNVAAAWRSGTATPTALLTDNQLPAGAVQNPVCLPAGHTGFAFISSSAGTCHVSRIPKT